MYVMGVYSDRSRSMWSDVRQCCVCDGVYCDRSRSMWSDVRQCCVCDGCLL